jgi:hypothetical protein
LLFRTSKNNKLVCYPGHVMNKTTIRTPNPIRKLEITPFLRSVLLGILLFNCAGILAELLLLEHVEGFWQLLPVVLLTGSSISIVWFYFGKNTLSLTILRISMLLFLVCGAIGAGMHFTANMEFELELYPGKQGLELYWESLKGALPVLAPGTLVGLGLLGLVSTSSINQ